MIEINKNIPPNKYTTYAKAKHASYDGIEKEIKKELNNALMSEQGWLCAYCMTRISEETMHIEHILPRSHYPQLELDYNNLLAVCSGGSGNSPSNQTCDTSKGDKKITISPLKKESISCIGYSSDGSMIIENSDSNKECDIKVLNLNHTRLVAARKSALDTIRKNMRFTKDQAYKKRAQKLLEKYKGGAETKKEPYCGIIIHYLSKKV